MLNKKNEWKYICLVGLGKHSKNKLIPAIKKSKLILHSVVTSQLNEKKETFIYFKDITHAVNNIPLETLFIIATPPNLHYKQAKEILNSGFDVMIEKPAFLSLDELLEIQNICNNKNLVMAEMFMYFYSESFKILSERICKNFNNLLEIKSNFIIPNIPEKTFRNETSLASSLLSDIGCYPISFFVENNLDIKNLEVSRVISKDKKVLFKFEGSYKNIKLLSTVGHGDEYANFVELIFKDHFLRCQPFYYGVKTQKKIEDTKQGNINNIFLSEKNMFEVLLDIRKSSWLNNQKKRFRKMQLIANKFDYYKGKIIYPDK